MTDIAARTVVAFTTSQFNLSEQKPAFVDPDCFGDDLGQWLVTRLEGTGFCSVLGHVPDECWFIVVEARKGAIGSLLGQRHRGVPLSGVLAIRDAIAAIPDVSKVRWFTWPEFRSKAWVDLPGASRPDTP